MTTDDPMDRLRASVPDDHHMDPRAADRLEAALRIGHAERAVAAVPFPAWRRPLALGAVALVIVVATVATLVLRDAEPSAAVVIRDAAGVTVRLPDGSQVVDPADGFELPDGSIVSIADGGMATIADTTIEVAAVLGVLDGSLISRVDITTTTAVVIDDPATDREAEPTTTTTTVRTATTEPARDTDRPPDTTTTIERARDRPRDRTTTTHPPPDHTDDVSVEPVREPGAAIEIELRVEPTDGGFRVRWSVTSAEDGWQIVIQRRIGDGERTVVAGPTVDVEGEIIDRPDLPRGDGPKVRYRVAVLDEGGGVVGAGPFQSVRR